jgi:hypothetical protein
VFECLMWVSRSIYVDSITADMDSSDICILKKSVGSEIFDALLNLLRMLSL